jgi:sarcosine oxidase, subunit gamma
VTVESPGDRRHESLFATIGAREIPSTQIDLRLHRADAEQVPLLLPVEANTWLAWNDREVLWLAPDGWLITANAGSADPGRLISELETLLSGMHHSLVDVSANRAVWELAGEDRYELLSAGCGLDLHPRSWRDGMCAQTLLARIPVILQERADTTRVFVRPSYRDYLVDWLQDSAYGPIRSG